MNQPNHPILSGGTFGAMSGEKPMYKAHVTPTHEHLVRLLKRIGLRFEETHGKYEQPERSVLIYHPRLDQMKMLGKMFGQESIIFSQGGNHELHYTNGPDEGKIRRVVPGAPPHEWFHEPPSDYYTHIPQNGYFRINFDFNGKPHDGTETLPVTVSQPSLTKNEVNMRPWAHPNAYHWHDGHTNHHKADPLNLAKAQNPQAAGVGVSTYAKYATPFGRIEPGQATDLMHYDLRDKLPAAQELVRRHGFKVYYAGGKFGKPDLVNKNYNTNHLMIYDPTPQSGGDFGEQNYTDAWRHLHELSHALVLPELNKIYGEGRRMGKLGVHRTLNEAMRAVHWEHLAAHKQRELSKMIGVSVPDDVFNKEYNTVMHDAVHRAVTGQFTEPSQEGFVPNSHPTPLETSLDMVRDAGTKMGLTDHHRLLGKSELRSPILGRRLAKAWPKNEEENQTNAIAHSVIRDNALELGATEKERGTQITVPELSPESEDRMYRVSEDVDHLNARLSESQGDSGPSHPSDGFFNDDGNVYDANSTFGENYPAHAELADSGFWSHPHLQDGRAGSAAPGVPSPDRSAWERSPILRSRETLAKAWPKSDEENAQNQAGFLNNIAAQDRYIERTGAVPSTVAASKKKAPESWAASNTAIVNRIQNPDRGWSWVRSSKPTPLGLSTPHDEPAYDLSDEWTGSNRDKEKDKEFWGHPNFTSESQREQMKVGTPEPDRSAWSRSPINPANRKKNK